MISEDPFVSRIGGKLVARRSSTVSGSLGGAQTRGGILGRSEGSGDQDGRWLWVHLLAGLRGQEEQAACCGSMMSLGRHRSYELYERTLRHPICLQDRPNASR